MDMDVGSNSVKNLLLKIFKGLGSVVKGIVWNKWIVQNVNKSTEKHNLSSEKALARKNPGQGIYRFMGENEKGLSKEEADYISKRLLTYRQDFSISGIGKDENGKDLYRISVVAGNKNLAKNLQSDFAVLKEKNKLQPSKPRVPFEKQLSKGAEKAREMNDKCKNLEIHKHRNIGAR